MHLRRRLALALLPLAVASSTVLAVSSAGAAEPYASIESVTPRDGGLVVRVRSTDLPAGT